MGKCDERNRIFNFPCTDLWFCPFLQLDDGDGVRIGFVEAKTGGERLAKDALVSIMKEEKPNQKEQFKIPKEKISRFFAPGTPTQKIEDTIVKALELYRKRQRSLER